jgi:hypothetical protein
MAEIVCGIPLDPTNWSILKYGYTYMERAVGAADGKGILDAASFAARASITARIGTLYGSGLSWTSRDSVDIGYFSGYGPFTVTGLSIDVEVGDIPAVYVSAGGASKTRLGTSSICKTAGNAFDGTAKTYTVNSTAGPLQLHMTGEEASVGSKAFMHYYNNLMAKGIGRQ